MAKKQGSGGSLIIIAVAMIGGAIAAIPKEVWILAAIVGAAYIVLRLFGSKSADSPPPSAEQKPIPKVSISYGVSRDNQPVTIHSPHYAGSRGFTIPAVPGDMGPQATWMRPGETCQVQGFTLPGGMLYVGPGPQSHDRADPALINPNLPVSPRQVDLSERLTDYWPSYSRISPDARRGYLQWLASGRNAPDANIGYVFLFFYGLERRALIDAKSSAEAKEDLPAIQAEILRLLAVYRSNGSFQSYGSNLLSYLSIRSGPSRLYDEPPPNVPDQYYGLPLRMRIGLAQLARDSRPVNAEWALAWALSDPNIGRRTPVRRCPDQFARLFKTKYAQLHGEGLRLSINRTKLKYSYRAASAALLGQEFCADFGDLPDITAVTGPVKKLQAIVDGCSEALDGYSRFLGRNPEKAETLDALLQLPAALWPAEIRADLDDLKARVGDGIVIMSFGELSGRLKNAGTLTRDKVLGLARALESENLGIEPDVLAGAKHPKTEDSIVLFATHPEDGTSRSTPAYQAAAVTLDLACAVALADGDASGVELLHVTQHIDSWLQFSQAHRKRLKAHLRHQIAQPTTLASMKKKLDTVAAEAKRPIARFLANLAQADGVIAPQEVKLLEKIYVALGLDRQEVYGDLHTIPGQVSPSSGAEKVSSASFSLDPARIAALQAETEQVSALLAGVFAGDQQPEEHTSEVQDVPVEVPGQHILGLDSDYSTFLRALLARPRWARQELADLAADLELMLDGALEAINDAAFDAHDAPITEGDDPVEINPSLAAALAT